MFECSDEKFDGYVREAYNKLPKRFLRKIDNVEILVEENSEGFGGKSLLGLYSGVPLNHRNTAYGMYPIPPDIIRLFKHNICRIIASENELKSKIFEVLYHEIGHYFGMNEEQIRNSMRDFDLEMFE
jgi:predicted Zn-dependent protease with MMP-like domain